MSSRHVRNAIALLLVLTLANIVASFATLYAVHLIRDVEHATAVASLKL